MPVASKRDYYEVLSVSRTASADEIKAAFRRLARKWHPDVNRDNPEAEERFKELNEAYSVLSDPDQRARYDRFGHAGVNSSAAGSGVGGAGMGGIEDLFDLLVGGMTGRSRGPATGPQPGADLRYDLEITLEEAAFGVTKTFDISRLETCETCAGSGGKPGTQPETCTLCRGAGQVRQTQATFLGHFSTVTACPRCQGRGVLITAPCETCGGQGRRERTRQVTVEIPAGVDTGSRMVQRGMGEAGERGGGYGDLYIVMHVQPHPVFERRGRDLACEVPISFVRAALGGVVEVPTLSGTEKISIPAGTQAGDIFRLRARGLPDAGRTNRGDQHVMMRVEIPTELNERQRRALEEYAAASGEDDLGEPEPEGVLEKLRNLFDRFTGRDEE